MTIERIKINWHLRRAKAKRVANALNEKVKPERSHYEVERHPLMYNLYLGWDVVRRYRP